MTKKVLKTRTQFTSTLKNELYEALRALSKETKVPISRLIDEAVEGLIEEYKGDKK